jgi:hypothetical protein
MLIALVKIDVAAVDLNRSAQQVRSLAEGGTAAEPGLLWVFNLAANASGQRRDLRFWRGELRAYSTSTGSACRQKGIEQVLAEILPAQRNFFSAGEIDQLFQIRPRTRIDLNHELQGELNHGRYSYARASLAKFLTRRWLGGEIERRFAS